MKTIGLYDPVLDDTEMVLETPEPADFDRQSAPTEVPFKVEQFIEPSPELNGFDQSPSRSASIPIEPISRSLTASPFVTPTKPYRPFSTEPLPEIPPLEEPIILNPNYNDIFGKSFDEFDNVDSIISYADKIPGSKFKLPISEQYDPEGLKKKTEVNKEDIIENNVYKEIIFTESVSKKETQTCSEINKHVTKAETVISENTKREIRELKTNEEKVRDEKKYYEEMKREIDIETIEKTALNIVDESIERAVSVAKEIKQEMCNELITKDEVKTKEKKDVVKCDENKIENVKSFDETNTEPTENMTQKNIVEQTHANEYAEKGHEIDIQQKQQTITYSDTKKKQETIENISSKNLHLQTQITDKNIKQNHNSTENIINENKRIMDEKKIQKERHEKETIKQVDEKTNRREEAQNRVYTIGLQTIPNIKGVVHSQHYDLLLKTFFIHLTDVMVALSRFILTQPAYSKLETENIDKNISDSSRKSEYEQKTKKTTSETSIAEHAQHKILHDNKHKQYHTEQIDRVESKEAKRIITLNREENIAAEEIKARKTSAAKMSQLCEKKSEEYLEKMGSVISELEVKTKEESDLGFRMRRSSSRNLIEEEVMRESDPLEWLHKVDSRRASQEKEIISQTQQSSAFESNSIKKTEARFESSKCRSPSLKPGKQTYLAVAEAHVYTNPDVIFEDFAAEISETQSMHVDEVKTATERSEAMVSESVAFEASDMIMKEVKAAVQESQDLKTAEVKTHNIEQLVKKVSEQVMEAHLEEKVSNVLEGKEILTQEIKESVESLMATKQDDLAISVAESTAFLSTSTQETIQKVETVQKVATDNTEISIEEHDEITDLKSENEIYQETTQIIQDRDTIFTESEIEAVNEIIEVKFKDENVKNIESVSVVEQSALSVSETEVLQNNISESIVKEEAAVTESILEQQSSTAQVTEVSIQTAKNECFELTKQEVDISESIELNEKKSTTLHVESEIIVNDPSELKIENQNDMHQFIEVIKERDSATEICKVETCKDEFTALNISKYESQEVEEQTNIIDEINVAFEVSEINITNEQDKAENLQIETESNIATEVKSTVREFEDEFAALKITKYQVTEENKEDYKSQISSKHVEMNTELFTTSQDYQAEHQHYENEYIVESSFTARTGNHSLTLRTDLDRQVSVLSDENNNIDTPSPSIPATPLTDEYVFRLEIPLPKSRGTTPIPPEPEPVDDEDPHIVKKKLIPHVDIEIEDQIIYDPPLPTPPGSKPTSPVYTKPGLRGGADRPAFRKDEIREIERKSSLLASAIDETIKSIEEYKEQVGIETRKETKTKMKIEHSSKEAFEAHSGTKKNIANGDIVHISKTYKSKEIKSDEKSSEGEIADFTKRNIDKTFIKQESPRSQDSKEIKIEKASEVSYESFNSKDLNTEINSTIIESVLKTGEITDSNENKSIPNNSSDELSILTKEIKSEESKESEIKNLQTVQNVDLENCEMKSADNLDVKEVIDTTYKELAAAIEGEKIDYLQFIKPVKFDPEGVRSQRNTPAPPDIEELLRPHNGPKPYVTESGEPLGTAQGIVDGLEEAIVDEEIAKELGKPGITEEKIAELISGEAEMLREAHVMGLSRVLSSHMHRPDDSVDFKKIKPMIDSLKDSEVLKALNEEEERKAKEQKKKEEKRWTTFLQKPKRPVPRAKFGYYRFVHEEPENEDEVEEPYKVKIVKQPKPKVAPDYKPEDFETGPLPWEERAVFEASLPPVEPEEPILVPEEGPEFLEAVDPLPESEVPDLEETGIPLPPPVPEPEVTPPCSTEEEPVSTEIEDQDQAENKEDLQIEEAVEYTEKTTVEMEENRIATELMKNVQSMVDPNAPLERQLAQMRAQLAALAQLPCVIQQTLEQVTKQLMHVSHQECHQIQQSVESQMSYESFEHRQESHNQSYQAEQNIMQHALTNGQQNEESPSVQIEELHELPVIQEEVLTPVEATLSKEELAVMKREEQEMIEEQRKSEKEKKAQELEQLSRQVKQHPTPRVGKPKPKFGPLNPEERPLVLPGGKKWKGPKDVYDEQMLEETLKSQLELIQGKAMGINFMKYEKPPVSLDHLQRSEVYKVVHDMDQTPLRRVELLTPVIAEEDYRERCRSRTPATMQENRTTMAQQLQR